MNLLVLDHFFDQDIDSLRKASPPGVSWRVWPYQPLRWEALRIFPDRVTGDLEHFAGPDMSGPREQFAVVFEELLHNEFRRFPFDALVVPSDTFFYVRSAPVACHRLGVPFFVVQKETVIAEYTMSEYSVQVAKYAPPLHDHMTVCSERHKEFWLRAGAVADTITVTGQPRFDFYSAPPDRSAGRTLLFFSYLVDAYHPEEGVAPVWRELHEQTLTALVTLAREGWRVLVKPHPQQAAPGLPDELRLVSPSADARHLIADADVVVGFQTTALFEAMLAGKPVIYTGWDPEADRVGDALIPFADWDEGIVVARSETALLDAVRGASPADEAMMAFRRSVVATFLGPVDGRASARTLEELTRVVAEFEQRRTPEADALRRRLSGQRPRPRIRRRLQRKADNALAAARTAVRR